MCTADPERKSASRSARPLVSRTIEGSDILVAAGRIPNTAGIGLEASASSWMITAIFVSMNAWRRRRPRFGPSGNAPAAHNSRTYPIDDFRIIRDNLAGGKRSTRDRLVPYCMFTDPPLAHVGLSEREAHRQGVTVRVARLPMSAVLRTRRPAKRKAS